MDHENYLTERFNLGGVNAITVSVILTDTYFILETNQGRLRRQLGEPLHESVTVTSSCFAVTSNNKFIFACGYWDKSFKCFSTESGMGDLKYCILSFY